MNKNTQLTKKQKRILELNQRKEEREKRASDGKQAYFLISIYIPIFILVFSILRLIGESRAANISLVLFLLSISAFIFFLYYFKVIYKNFNIQGILIKLFQENRINKQDLTAFLSFINIFIGIFTLLFLIDWGYSNHIIFVILISVVLISLTITFVKMKQKIN